MKLEHKVYKVCVGHIAKNQTPSMQCILCEVDDRNRECPYYKESIIYEIIAEREKTDEVSAWTN